MVLSTAALLVGVFLSNTSVMDQATNQVLQSISMCLGITGFAYTVLRHRVVDVSVVLDRTLVYGATTALVVGVVATMNSLALRATLGEGTSLLLQIVVPLALGIVLGKVRVYMDRTVEQVFFRSKYLAERALQDFARHCGHIENVQKLLQAAVTEIARHTRSPGVAFYELAEDGYFCMRQAGTVAYPAHVDMDDRAMVAARAELKAVDLSDYPGELGTDGCVFPMIVLGVLRGVLVCANRPGERFGSDEKQLLAQVASDVGAAWRILRARDNEDLVRALAKGTLKPAAARARAQALEATWMGQPLSA
jgi:small basic protein